MNAFAMVKPEYLARPGQILRRLAHGFQHYSADFTMAQLPWGVQIRVRPHEAIGQAILKLGLFDLAVTELLWRLTDGGDTVCDVGANIGHMTSVLNARVGSTGCVHAFEPHPGTFGELRHNVEQWQRSGVQVRVQLYQAALSDEPKKLTLFLPENFEVNRGSASVIGSSDTLVPTGHSVCVEALRLDDVIGHDSLGMLKIDVEGHELAVLRGASRALERKQIRDCVFEEHRPLPTDVSRYLEGFGFHLFGLEKRLTGPLLTPVKGGRTNTLRWESQSYLATIDPQRAVARFASKGWSCL
jgi:FkbM family methyltransferase